jgi:hypothetical protein
MLTRLEVEKIMKMIIAEVCLGRQKYFLVLEIRLDYEKLLSINFIIEFRFLAIIPLPFKVPVDHRLSLSYGTQYEALKARLQLPEFKTRERP